MDYRLAAPIFTKHLDTGKEASVPHLLMQKCEKKFHIVVLDGDPMNLRTENLKAIRKDRSELRAFN